VGGSQHTLDRIDREIIRLLNEDGRMSNAEIARRLGGVPPRSISHRVERLIARDIINVKAIVNPLALGYHVLADVLSSQSNWAEFPACAVHRRTCSR